MVNTFIITGNTWSCREALKLIDGRWVPHLNAWLVPEGEDDSVRRLRDRANLNVRLIALPIDLPGSSKAAAAARARAARSGTPSPAAR
jgi:hypothetical protein